MGGCLSSQNVEDPQHQQIEQYMRDEKKAWPYQTKVLLLGTGDSGKSTMLKQIRIINSVPFMPQEMEMYRQRIYSNLVEGIRALHAIMQESDIKCSHETKNLLLDVDTAAEVNESQSYPRYLLPIFQQIWNDPDFQKAVALGKQRNVPDNLSYYFRHLPRLFDRSYTPTNQDIIYSRAKTIGIHETQFVFGKQTISIIDVGGQRSERRKWIHCFQDVTAILFLVSLSGYDQALAEDPEVNQMQDAMMVWESICMSPWFEHTSLILFLNKEDLFAEKVTHSSIKRYFPDYDGRDRNMKDGLAYFKKRFINLHKKGGDSLRRSNSRSKPKIPARAVAVDERKVYPYFTTATDTLMVKNVMGFVNDIILLDNLAGSHML